MTTINEACKEYARNVGKEFPNVCWILTPWDTWEQNPFYQGKKVRHPEDDSDTYTDNNQVDDTSKKLPF